MKNLLIFAFAIIFCSCKKTTIAPVSKSATLHIEYEAKDSSYTPAPGFHSNVDIALKNGVTHYPSTISYDNIITLDLTMQGGQDITINGYVIETLGNPYQIPGLLKIVYNGKTLSDKTVASTGYQGKLEFIN